MKMSQLIETIIKPAYDLLPAAMNSLGATVILGANAGQESALVHRFQVVAGRPGVKGPARGLWQFEQGTRSSRGGVWGVYLHKASAPHLERLCQARSVPFNPTAIYAAVETDDIFACGVARLLLWTDPKRLPDPDDADGAFALYLRTWRPGAYDRGTPEQRESLRLKYLGWHRQAFDAATGL